ncbi:uncharacterized protein P174DRAFT_515979 [Aspergillus novofumigatus IBT 16806]|uniref:ceramidase n=1 Tax=Aspergillus novofumigatus (strain IBT 16806) TaxID=1392255 RepID=A0A2I1BV73_ASPN1|nr:uncharacterized protein P174DRAFT_515979 [Aspergillus novofumigatus IBT 16806]PKX89290.1 hypothetical protein P174DRAFT_515979 [Aspergillus novofumigatus IBT 16806]
MPTMEPGDVPPTYRIDLSRPPAERYVEVAKKYRNELRSLTALFDSLVESIAPSTSLEWVKRLARLFLRRATGIEMYLIVSLNVLLDVLMGCTSGAARAQDKDMTSRMLHFRTLDWGMDALRRVLVQFEYVRGPDYETVLATNITYIGFVGVLTGVRKGLSVSLNFRPNHDLGGWLGDLRFYGSHLLVMLGLRRSISSMLRQYIIPREDPRGTLFGRMLGVLVKRRQRVEKPTLSSICQQVMRTPSTASYLVLCDGAEAAMIEKDHRTARMDSSSSFIVATNNDFLGSELPPKEGDTDISFGAALTSGEPISMTDFIQDSKERRACMQAHWDKKVAQAGRSAHGVKPRHDPLRRTRSSRSRVADPVGSTSTSLGKESAGTFENHEVAATPAEIIQWTAAYPTTNEMTHFSAVMDPTSGRVIWIRRFRDPLDFHMW